MSTAGSRSSSTQRPASAVPSRGRSGGDGCLTLRLPSSATDRTARTVSMLPGDTSGERTSVQDDGI